MLGRILQLFKKKPVRIEGVGQLPAGQAKKVTLGDPLAGEGVDLILANLDGELHALDARCPHAGGFIAEGPLIEGRLVQCPLHRYNFDVESGECKSASCGKARVYKTRRDGDALEVFI